MDQRASAGLPAWTTKFAKPASGSPGHEHQTGSNVKIFTLHCIITRWLKQSPKSGVKPDRDTRSFCEKFIDKYFILQYNESNRK